MSFKVINKRQYTIKKKILKDSLAFMQHFQFVNWWFHFLMSRAGQQAGNFKEIKLLFFCLNLKLQRCFISVLSASNVLGHLFLFFCWLPRLTNVSCGGECSGLKVAYSQKVFHFGIQISQKVPKLFTLSTIQLRVKGR